MTRVWTLLLFVGLLFSVYALAHEPNAPAAEPGIIALHNFTKDTVVYVSDFELDAENVKVDKGGLLGEARPGILERPRKREQHDPEEQAKKLVSQMSESLVSDLQKAGYKTQRFAPGASLPSSGAWVHGIFTEVDEGNQRRRAIIGFGAGEAKMDLYVTLSDLSHPSTPLYNLATVDNSGKKVGALVTMNPYVAAAKYVMEKNASEKTVKKTAKEIADRIGTTLKQSETTAGAH